MIVVLTWVLVILTVAGILYAPFLVGKVSRRDPDDAMLSIFLGLLQLLPFGRVLGWW